MGCLLDSIYHQDYRPIEVLVVDGGSKDRTFDIVKEKQNEHNSENFSIRFLREKDYGGICSQPNARNIGIEQSRGNYLFFLDADIFFIEDSSLGNVKEKLDEVPFCCVRIKHEIDNELERQIAMGDVWKIHAGAYRREIFSKNRFNPNLGLGEDEDFWYRAGIHFDNVCETTLGRHFPHTIEEYKKQQIWYGKTFPTLMKVICTEERQLFWRFFFALTRNTFYLLIPMFLAVSFFVSVQLFAMMLSLWLLSYLIPFYKSPEKNLKMLAFLVWRSFFEAYYFMYGLLSSLS